jgi:hypothetical protein
MHRLTTSVMAHSLFTPLADSLLLTWNPSFCVVLCCPPWSQVTRELTYPSSSLSIPNSHHPRSIVRPTKTTSRSRLHMVRNRKVNDDAHSQCPTSGSKCGFCEIFLVCSIQVHPLESLLVDLAWSGLFSGHMIPLNMISHMARLNKDPLYITLLAWYSTNRMLHSIFLLNPLSYFS